MFLLLVHLLGPMSHVAYQSLISFSYNMQLILSMFLEQPIILCQSHLTLKILVRYAIVLLNYAKMGPPVYLSILQSNLKMLYWLQNTSPDLHQHYLDHTLQYSNKKLFCNSIIQLQSIILFNNTYGWLSIYIGILLCVEQTILLKLGQFAKTISCPPSNMEGFPSVLL